MKTYGIAFVAALVVAPLLTAQVPQIINYQGRVAVGTTNFNGMGQFKFALVNASGSTSYWSNDGTSTSGSEPTNAVGLNVANGLYAVTLGDTAIPNMTVIPNSVFANTDVRLRVWFNDGTNGSQLLTPDQRLATVGYSMMAGGVHLPATTSANTGIIKQNGVNLLHTFGTDNLFVGADSGNFITTGIYNVAGGVLALRNDTSGSLNTALGYQSLIINTTGNRNTACGNYSMIANTSGGFNVAVGGTALGANSTGSFNIAIGNQAGANLTTGNSNIDIGNSGVAGESNIIRIGSAQSDTYLAGVIHGDGSGLTAVTAANFSGSVNGSQIVNATVGSAKLTSNLTLQGTTSGTFSGALTGNASTSTSFTGNLTGDVSGTQGSTVVNSVGGLSATNVAAGATLANAATNANNASTIVKRDGSGNFTGGTIAAGTFTSTGVINLPATSGAGVGVLVQNGSAILHTYGSANFFTGPGAGNFTMSGSENVAVGTVAMSGNTSGGGNTASGYGALQNNTSGSRNTAIGGIAMGSNTQTGSDNTAVGCFALQSNTTGVNNTAVGSEAGRNVTSIGSNNVAIGYQAGRNVTSGSNNIAIGVTAGSQKTTGNNNIDIGNDGFQNETGVIRIGTNGTHTKAVFNGIFGATTGSGIPVLVNSGGLLGTTTSSRRFKRDIVDMAAASEVLLKLRPVSFRYKEELDPDGRLQFGLVAEEVNEVCPDLVVRDDKGEIYTVRYDAVNAMLLNEVLKDHRRTEALAAKAEALKVENDALQQRLSEVTSRLEKIEQALAMQASVSNPKTETASSEGQGNDE